MPNKKPLNARAANKSLASWRDYTFRMTGTFVAVKLSWTPKSHLHSVDRAEVVPDQDPTQFYEREFQIFLRVKDRTLDPMYLVHETEIWILLSARVQIPDLIDARERISDSTYVHSERDRNPDPN